MKFLILSLLLLSSCATVQQADVDAWKGVNVIELETHPVFSSMSLEKRELSNGTIQYNYINKGSRTSPTNCYKNMNGSTNCYGGNSVSITCNNQFSVKDKIVLEYRPLGKCYTDCSARPESRPCN